MAGIKVQTHSTICISIKELLINLDIATKISTIATKKIINTKIMLI